MSLNSPLVNMMHHQNAGSKGETTVQTIMQQMQWTYVIGDAKKNLCEKISPIHGYRFILSNQSLTPSERTNQVYFNLYSLEFVEKRTL